jgi:hypothetical protein
VQKVKIYAVLEAALVVLSPMSALAQTATAEITHGPPDDPQEEQFQAATFSLTQWARGCSTASVLGGTR